MRDSAEQAPWVGARSRWRGHRWRCNSCLGTVLSQGEQDWSFAIWADAHLCKTQMLHLFKICLQCGRPGFNPWVRMIAWRRIWQPTPVLLPGKFHGWRSLVGYSSWDCRVGHNWATSLIHWFPILANAALYIQSLDTETFESFYSFFSLNPHTQSINYITKTEDASSLTSLE